MTKISERFAQYCKFKREKLGLSQAELCFRAFGYRDKVYIWKIENGRKGVSIDYMEKLLLALESDVKFIDNSKPNSNESE